MTKPDLVAHKSSRVSTRLARVQSGIAVGSEAFLSRIDLIEQVAFNMFLAIQSARRPRETWDGEPGCET
jgi:hypothetical protein